MRRAALLKSSLFILFLALFSSLSGCGGDSGNSGGLAAPWGVSIIPGNSSLTLSWEPVSGAASYNVYIATEPGITKDNYGKLSGGTLLEWNASPRIIRDLLNDTTYYLVVTAKGGNLESSESIEVSAAPVALPSPPSSINAVADDGKVTLSWNSKGGETYNIYWSYSPGISLTSYDGVINSASTPYLHSSLANDTKYYYAISAVNTYGESVLSEEVSATPFVVSGSLVDVAGIVHFEDKEYGRGGFTGNYLYQPLRYASVELVDAGSSAVLATGNTDSYGQFAISFTASAATSLYVRIISETGGTGVPLVQVMNLAGYLQSAAGADVTVNPGGALHTDITIPVSAISAGYFNILHVLTAGGEFIKALSGTTPPLAMAYWQNGNDYYGTWFCRAGDPDPDCINDEGIYILGGNGFDTGDHDEFDDDVIWHEYGHFVADKYSRDDSEGGIHFLLNTHLDLRLSWSEGWSNFFLYTVKDWLINNNASLLSVAAGTPSTVYVDVRDSSQFIFDIAEPASGMIYSSNEMAVSNVLLNLKEGTSAGLTGIWSAFSDYIPNRHDSSVPVNMEAFWDGWLDSVAPTGAERVQLESVFKERKIDYSLDTYEVDNTPPGSRKISPGASELHSLYSGDLPSVADSDYLAFDATEGITYLISTSDLINGADTYLKLIDRDGSTLLDENDNGNPDQTYTDGNLNDGTTLASSIAFTAYSTGTYYVEVSTSLSSPVSAGRYGSYWLTLGIQ